jgi:hypothetical protein
MESVQTIWDAIEADPTIGELALRSMSTVCLSIPAIGFEQPHFDGDLGNRYRFLNGLDDVGITMTHVGAIDLYESTCLSWLPAQSSKPCTKVSRLFGEMGAVCGQTRASNSLRLRSLGLFEKTDRLRGTAGALW